MKKAHKLAIQYTLIALLLIGGGWLLWRYIASLPEIKAEDIISRSGLHWHPELVISIRGERRTIPADIGLGAVHEPTHTHAEDGVVHLEYAGLVLRENTRLGEFFRIWGKTFTKDCVFEYCNGPEGRVTMTVNGIPNEEYGDYEMKDGDKVEIRYE
ncbi:MAG: hypothetical protein UZ00_C0004G0009 [Parcubacteria group bacterium GW2011_GWA1_60_11]|nr:MAG: hypothetical protein UZ00_C0004G0009 [Parcubacteria group bacterium GW2011_GWA1_60_11]